VVTVGAIHGEKFLLNFWGTKMKKGKKNMDKIRKAVIPAAGFGTRFLPATKAMPKEMLPIVDKPTIQYIVEEIMASGIQQILIISGHAKRSIENHFDSAPELEQHLYEQGKMELLKEIRKISDIQIFYVRQKHMRGLGDAILCAKDFIDGEPFGVILGDDIVYTGTKEPALRQLMDQYYKTGTTIIGCQVVAPEQVSSYGIIDGVETKDKNLLKVKDMIEKPSIKEAPSRFAALGRYVITPDIFSILEETQPGKGGEIQLTDALRVQAHKSGVYAYNFEGKRYDAGNKMGYLKTVVEFALRREDIGEEFKAYLKELVAKL
jgi:UTP--glucose-1-phosphate uridylyltransferase